MFYKLVNAYTSKFSFPYRGLKYFLRLAKWLNIADRTYKKRLPGNIYMHLNPTEHIQQQLFWYGIYEAEINELICRILKPGDVFLDVGANIGYFSVLAATKQPAATVVAIEPVKHLFTKLKENIAINKIENITAINAAAGDVNEEKEIYLSAGDNWGMSSFQKPENYSGETQNVEVRSIGSWFVQSGLPRLDLLKIDVEGYELNVLKGMRELLIRFKPILLMEINPGTLSMFDIRPADVINFLSNLDFDIFDISRSGNLTKRDNEINQVTNVCFIHQEKRSLYPSLFRSQ